MPSTVQIIRAHECIRATPEGNLDFEESKKLLVEIASLAKGLGEYKILLDLRRAAPQLNTADLWYLAKEVAQLGATYRRKTALLTLLQEFENAEFWALSAQNRGYQIHAFVSFEDAIEWLIQDNTWGDK